MTGSAKLARQLKTHLGHEDAGVAAKHFEKLQALLRDVDTAYVQQTERLKLALRNLDISSQEMIEANLQMEQLNQSLAAVLDSLGQAILFFDKNGICSNIFSKACLTLLECDPGGKHVGEVLRLDAEGREQLMSLLDIAFPGQSTIFSFDELMKHAPRRYAHSRELSVALDYRAMYSHSGKMTGILVIAQDVTRDEQAKEEIRVKEARIVRMLRIAKDKLAFTRYLHGMERSLLSPAGERTAEQVAREIHTLKGLSKFFHMETVANILHEMETVLNSPGVSAEEVLSTCRERLEELCEEARGFGREIWGANFEIQEEVLTIPVSQATEFGQELRQHGAQGIAFSFFRKIVAQPVRDLLVPFETQLTYFAEMSDKAVNITPPDSGEVRVFAIVYKELIESLVHMARNIVDHAAQAPEVREAAGKTPALNVKIDVCYENEFKHNMLITIADDGAGVNVDKLRERYEEAGGTKGLDKEKLLQHIFDAKISTRDVVTETSGRGIGLDAVKAAAEKLNGSIHVDSEPGQGTVFALRLPVIWEP
jgi:two-component system, chemotaxis family, sensor kinase CheA